MKLKDFLEDYSYVIDKDKHGVSEHWEKPKKEERKGDCNFFLLFLFYYISDFKNKNKEIYFCKYYKQGHVILKVDDMYIDNIQKKLVPFESLVGYTKFRRIYMAEVYLRYAFSFLGVYRLVDKIKCCWGK